MTSITRIAFCLIILAFAAQTFSNTPPSTKRRVSSTTISAHVNSEKDKIENIRRQAFADPFNEEKLKAYREVLPKDGDLYVVEGDILLTEQELLAYVVGKSQAQSLTSDSPELLVNMHNGERDYYKDRNGRKLTYAVDKNSFPDSSRYQKAVAHMRKASLDWQNICLTCRLKITHANQVDTAPSHSKVNFIVRFRDTGGAYIAAAFFPHDAPDRRYVNIDPSYFTTTFDKVGVLRHELGHVLGYRHEHIRNVPGCFLEDNNWQPLTEYDPRSVMHYFCGGAGSLSLAITPLDRTGHRRLYRLP